jgi:hypothetical protein
MTKAERQHLSRVAELGCIICRRPAEIHHIRAGVGMGKRSSHFNVIGLCPEHHRGIDHPNTPSIHLDKANFIRLYGTEAELLARVQALI